GEARTALAQSPLPAAADPIGARSDRLYRPGLIGHFPEGNLQIGEKPDPVAVTMAAMTPGEKLLSAAAASRLGLRRDWNRRGPGSRVPPSRRPDPTPACP